MMQRAHAAAGASAATQFSDVHVREGAEKQKKTRLKALF
jgi:hypothetical protein